MVAVGGFIPVGYYKDEVKTAATFRTFEGRRWSVPGDWAEVNADGTLHLLGRGSVCINTGGEKVFPEEVEEALKTHPAVRDAVVVGVPDDALRRGDLRASSSRRTAPSRRPRRAGRPRARAARRLQGAAPPRRRRHDRPGAERQGRLQAAQGPRRRAASPTLTGASVGRLGAARDRPRVAALEAAHGRCDLGRLATGEPVLMPGVWDALSVKLAAEAGFDTVFLSGYCVAGTQLGLPDFGYLTQSEMAEVARRVVLGRRRRRWSWSTPTPATATRSTPCARSSCGSRPGRPASSSRTRSGRSGAGTWPASRSCAADEWLAKLRAACDHRDRLHVTARTDARAAVGLDEAIERARMARDAGVDAVFVEAPESDRRARGDRRGAAGRHPRGQHGRDGQDAAAHAGRAGRPRLHADRVAARRCCSPPRRRCASSLGDRCAARARCATTSTSWSTSTTSARVVDLDGHAAARATSRA